MTFAVLLTISHHKTDAFLVLDIKVSLAGMCAYVYDLEQLALLFDKQNQNKLVTFESALCIPFHLQMIYDNSYSADCGIQREIKHLMTVTTPWQHLKCWGAVVGIVVLHFLFVLRVQVQQVGVPGMIPWTAFPRGSWCCKDEPSMFQVPNDAFRDSDWNSQIILRLIWAQPSSISAKSWTRERLSDFGIEDITVDDAIFVQVVIALPAIQPFN
jgi:hypothetical protein